MPVNNAALVVGGGVAGMTAALALAEQGFPVHLVEKIGQLGGTARQLHPTLDGQDVQAFLADTIRRVDEPPADHRPSETRAAKVDGHVGKLPPRADRVGRGSRHREKSSTAWWSWPPGPRKQKPKFGYGQTRGC